MSVWDLASWISYSVQLALSGTLAVLAFWLGSRRGYSQVFFLLAGFNACLFLGNTFYILSWALADYPYVFSPGDLSWIGGHFFLIAIAIEQMGELKEKSTIPRRSPWIIASIAALCVFLLMAIELLVYPEIWFSLVMYGIPSMILAYQTMQIILTAGCSSEIQRYNICVFLFVLIEMVQGVFSCYGLQGPTSVLDYGVILMTLLIFLSARKGGLS